MVGLWTPSYSNNYRITSIIVCVLRKNTKEDMVDKDVRIPKLKHQMSGTIP